MRIRPRWLMGLAAGALQMAALHAWLGGAALPGLLFHGLSSFLLLGVSPLACWRIWALVTGLSLPLVGWMLVLLTSPGHRFSRESRALACMQEFFKPKLSPDPPPPLSYEEGLAQALTTPDTICRQRPLQTPQASISGVQRLLQLLKDPTTDAYHVASARLAKIQEQLAVSIFQATQDQHAQPDSVIANERLAEAYVDYLRSGLLEGPLADFYYRLAVARFEHLAQLQPDRPRWLLRVAELHRRNGHYGEALQACDVIFEKWPDHMETHMRVLEIYYYGARLGVSEANRNFAELLERLQGQMQAESIEDPWLRRAAQWWFPCAPQEPALA